MTHHDRDTADMSKHSDEQLREGIDTVHEQEQRVATEDSGEALNAQQDQRRAMEEELEQREGDR
ncbi:MAG: hypothetical protein H0V05_13845 [Euzebyaceae bacterium]|nr:hypothetical protein [Euzebyaceae bacterium]